MRRQEKEQHQITYMARGEDENHGAQVSLGKMTLVPVLFAALRMATFLPVDLLAVLDMSVNWLACVLSSSYFC